MNHLHACTRTDMAVYNWVFGGPPKWTEYNSKKLSIWIIWWYPQSRQPPYLYIHFDIACISEKHQSWREIDPSTCASNVSIGVLQAGGKQRYTIQIPRNRGFKPKTILRIHSTRFHHRPLRAVLGILPSARCIQVASGSTFSSSLWSLARGLKARTIKVPNMMDIAVRARPGDSWSQKKKVLICLRDDRKNMRRIMYIIYDLNDLLIKYMGCAQQMSIVMRICSTPMWRATTDESRWPRPPQLQQTLQQFALGSPVYGIRGCPWWTGCSTKSWSLTFKKQRPNPVQTSRRPQKIPRAAWLVPSLLYIKSSHTNPFFHHFAEHVVIKVRENPFKE